MNPNLAKILSLAEGYLKADLKRDLASGEASIGDAIAATNRLAEAENTLRRLSAEDEKRKEQKL